MPRTCPSADATICTYVWWFARPAGSRQPGPLVIQPLSARCMRNCCVSGWVAIRGLLCWAGAQRFPGPSMQERRSFMMYTLAI